MKTILAILSIFALFSGAMYLFNQQQDDQSLKAYEELITFDQGHLRWNLSQQNLDDQQIRSIAKTIQRGKIQQEIGSNVITSIYLDLSKNKSTLNFKPIIDSINSSLSTYLTSFYIDLSYIDQKWDYNFEGFQFPAQITHIGLNGYSTRESSLDNFTKAVSNCDKLVSFEIDFYDGYFKNINEIMKILSEQEYLQNLSLNLNKVYKDVNNEQFRDYLKKILSGNNISTINLGFESITNMDTNFLNDLEEIFYDKFQSGQYQSVQMNIKYVGIYTSKIQEIFSDLSKTYGEQFTYQY